MEENRMAEWLEEMSNMPKNYWLKLGRPYNKYMTPEQVLKTGLIDEIF